MLYRASKADGGEVVLYRASKADLAMTRPQREWKSWSAYCRARRGQPGMTTIEEYYDWLSAEIDYRDALAEWEDKNA